MWTSVAYHLFNPMSYAWFETLLTFDLSGVMAVTGANTVVIAFHLYAEVSFERSVLLAVIVTLITSNIVAMFHKKCKTNSMHCFKVTMITSTVMLCFSSVIVARLFYSKQAHVDHIYPRLLTSALAFGSGLVIWLTRFPECTFLGKYRIV